MAYDETLKNAGKFGKLWKPMPFFHLRPKSDGATLVCTIPKRLIAMRGKNTGVFTLINKRYDELSGVTSEMDTSTILTKLKDWGFNERGETDKDEAEFHVQSMYINMLYDNPNALSACGYSNVRFIASEFVYTTETDKGNRRVDVIAEADEGILMIEVKVGEDMNSGDNKRQLLDYRDFYFGKDNRDNTIKLLKTYPNHRLTADKPVVPIYLLAEGNKTPSVAGEEVVVLRYSINGDKITVRN